MATLMNATLCSASGAVPAVRNRAIRVCARSATLTKHHTYSHTSFRRRRVPGPVCFREGEKKDAKEKLEKQADKAVEQAKGVLSNSSTQSGAYNMLAVASGATALAALIAPARFAGLMFQTATDSVVDHLVRTTGAALLATTATKYTLKEASVRNMLNMDTYKRLNAGLVLQTALGLVVLAQGVSVRTPYLLGFVGGICGVGLLAVGRMYSLSREGFVIPNIQATLSSALSVFTPRNASAAMYSVLSVAFAVMGGWLFASTVDAPMRVLSGTQGPVAVFMNRMTGAGFFLSSIMAFCLKDAAERAQLGAVTFRWLNLGLAAHLLAQAAVLGLAVQSGLAVQNNMSLGMLAFEALFFIWTAYNYVTAEASSV